MMLTCQPGAALRRHLRTIALSATALAAALVVMLGSPALAHAKKLQIVATIRTYGAVAKEVVGGRGTVVSIAKGYEDPHFVRPKPSLARVLANADLLVSTGLDLELWLPSLMDKAGNARIRSGQPGFVSASAGIALLDKPKVISRSGGGMHVYGNPHVYTGPLNGKIIARNIMLGLKKIDPEGAATYEKNYRRFTAKVDRKLFGSKLVKILGAKVLTKMALNGRLIPFLDKREYKGHKLIDDLGGWMKQGLPLRGKKIVAYHKNWAYFARTFGIDIIDYVEPKPGIPPSPAHVAEVVDKMKVNHVRALLAANYYSVGKVRGVASKVGAKPVIVGLAVGGQPAIKDYFSQYDVWLGRLVAAVR